MKHSLLPFLAVFFATLLLNGCQNSRDSKSFEAMNTFMTLQSYGFKSHKANIAVQKRILELEDCISTNRENSSIYKINHSTTNKIQINDETSEIIGFSLDISNKSQGALNIALYPVIKAWGFTTGEYRVPSEQEISELLKNTDYKKIHFLEKNLIQIESGMQLDLGALGKGYAGDEAIKILRQQEIKSAILDLGGNIQALGKKPDGSNWKVGIKNPWGGPVVAGVEISDKAVITSGGYERYFIDENGNNHIHIIDGKTGYPVENEIASVTIICDSGIYGDALSTTMFVLGVEKACEYWREQQDFDMIILTKDKQILYTEGLEGSISFRFDFSKISQIKNNF